MYFNRMQQAEARCIGGLLKQEGWSGKERGPDY